MSRFYHCGNEWQSASTFELGTVTGVLQSSTAQKYGGAASWLVGGSITAGNVIEGELPNLGGLAAFYAKGMIYIDAMDSSPTEEVVAYLSFAGGAGTNIFSVQFYNNAGTLHCTVYYNDFATQGVDTTTGIAFDTWMRVEVFMNTGPANGSEQLEVRINGSTIFSSSALTITTKTCSFFNWGVFNGTAGTISGTTVYFDDFAVNTTAGSVNNSWIGDSKVVAAVPSAAGDNNPTAGSFSSVNEIPATDTATSSANRIELDSNTNAADFNITNPTELGISIQSIINAVSLVGRIREESAGTSSYQLRIKSASGGSVTSSTAADAGNATARTNPNGTTAFGRIFISETDPTTGVAWTVIGTNSLQEAQIGLINVDANSTPDLWATAMALMIDYNPNVVPSLITSSRLRRNVLIRR